MTQYLRERDRADSIVGVVIDDLSGRAVQHADILDVEPQSKLCIGVLTPPPAEGDPGAAPRSAKRKPDALGFNARVAPNAGKIAGIINVSFLVYHRVLPTLDEQRKNIRVAASNRFVRNTAAQRYRSRTCRSKWTCRHQAASTSPLPRRRTS